ncbi:response regulator [Oleidesulfovibrio sp.]|uniref:response regulator n=1 Tax=Oleidesulfovibrio sp. TaxID=2909707 RepID=UPI003A89FD6E
MAIHVLLVDDEVDFVQTLAERLRIRGMTVDTAHDGEHALQIVDDCGASVMVLDLRLPGMDGMEVLRNVRKKCPHMQVIMLTGHGGRKDEDSARLIGVFEYLNKPVDISQLSEVIAAAANEAALLSAD